MACTFHGLRLKHSTYWRIHPWDVAAYMGVPEETVRLQDFVVKVAGPGGYQTSTPTAVGSGTGSTDRGKPRPTGIRVPLLLPDAHPAPGFKIRAGNTLTMKEGYIND